jgi:hypothetical protein
MPANISFTCQVLRGTNKEGLLKPDENGYYTVVLGGFNIRNEMGNYYPFNKYLEEIFKSSSTFMRKIEKGQLRGECDHPAPWKGMSEREWFTRLRKIETSRVSHHIRKVTLDFNNYRSQHGETMVAVLGEVKPAGGELGDKLRASLENPDEDTAFSIRTLTLDQPMVTGAWRKDVYECVTWDWVEEPGIRNAPSITRQAWSRLTRISSHHKLWAIFCLAVIVVLVMEWKLMQLTHNHCVI